MATERATSSIAVDTFRSSVDDFTEWIALFEDAVQLGTGVTDAARKEVLLLKWLPFRLDDEARTVYRGIASRTWADVKAELGTLLIDQQEAYTWQTNRSSLQWDGKESFHALAVRVRRAVDKYDPQAVKAKEYFFRFRQALPKRYQTAIDLGCAEDRRTIDEAKKIALRLQMTELDDDKSKVTFTGASMADDRLKSLEMDFKKMDVRMEAVEGKIDGVSEQLKVLVAKPKGYESSLERYETRYPDRRGGGRQFSRDRRGSWDRRDGRQYDGRQNEGYRNNSRNRQDSGSYGDRRYDRGRYETRYDGDRRRSWDRRDGVDRGPRSNSRDQGDHRNTGAQQGRRDQDGRGSRDRRPRDFNGSRDRQDGRERRPSQDRAQDRGARRDGSGDRGRPRENRTSGQGSGTAGGNETYRAAGGRTSADEDYDIYCSVMSDIEERRANRRKN